MDTPNVPSDYLSVLLSAYQGTAASVNDVVDQLNHEQAIRSFSHQRSLKRHQKARDAHAYSDTQTGRYAVEALLDKLEASLEQGHQLINRANARGPKHRALKLFENQPLSTRTIAYVALRAAIDCQVRWQGSNVEDVMNGSAATSVSGTAVEMQVAKRIYAEMKAKWAHKAAAVSFKNFVEQQKTSQLSRAKAERALARRMEHHNIQYLEEVWGPKDKAAIGAWIMEHMILSTGIVSLGRDVVTSAAGGKAKDLNKQYYRLDPQFVEWVVKTEDGVAMRDTVHEPMLIPPRPWSMDNLVSGPYVHPETPTAPMVKGMIMATHSEIQNRPAFQEVIDAVNAVQSVPYRINDYIRDAVRWALEQDEPVANLPAPRDVPYPPWSDDFRDDQEAKQRWIRTFRDAENKNAKRASHTYALHAALMGADKLSGRNLWFPCTMDSRGRIYPLAVFGVSPQGSDYQKAMLVFAEGAAIETKEQLNALYVQCATEGAFDGVDKVSLTSRVKWVEDNLEAIKAIGQDWRSNVGFWEEADHPFMFLAACREIYLFHEQGYGYVSTLPCYSDATCSGIQHYSALLRDEAGGFSVNLMPDHDRQDVYMLVAQQVTATLRDADISSLSVLQRSMREVLLEHGITRAAVKRQTMTKPYNSKKRSCRDYTIAWIKEVLAEGSLKLPDGMTAGQIGAFLGDQIYDAVEDVMPKACEAMQWIEAVTKQTVRANPNVPLSWDLPDGMVCITRKGKADKVRFATTFEGSQRFRRLNITIEEQSPVDHGNSMPPNFIHSLDAAHLRLTALLWEDHCARQGRPAAMTFVHDSFGVPAAHAPEFSRILREAFVTLYTEHDHLRRWLSSMQEIAGSDVMLPEPPALGSLELDGVTRSEFFFS